ncbi:hypothetical protein [Nocardioides limicola]|uniref:hypothetical protein n=1 Tax=Nocardioides limicola TaxID=2803368 RepID=UPI00193B0091|nr:hypothetical protein [Nocardioides sp. DJM-14]
MTQMFPSSPLSDDDRAALREMHQDCVAVASNMNLVKAERAAVRPAPSIHFEDFPREVSKRSITIDEATARLASALKFHLD